MLSYSIFNVAMIIVALLCIAIAFTWPKRPTKWIFCLFIFLSMLVPGVLGLIHSSVIYYMNTGVYFNSNYAKLQWLATAREIAFYLSWLVLIVYAVLTRGSTETKSVTTVSRPLKGPSWKTELDSAQKQKVSTKRNLAWFIDSAPFLAAATGYSRVFLSPESNSSEPSAARLALLFAFSFIGLLAALYILLKDGTRGQSIGKRLMGCRTVSSETGQPIGFTESLIRNLLFVIPFGPLVELATSIIRSDGKRLGDLMASTLVVMGPHQFMDGVPVKDEIVEAHPLDEM